MIAVDTNILVYAHREDSQWHRVAVTVLKGLAESGAIWAIPWSCVHEFISIVTHPRIYAPPTPMSIALKAIRSWRASPTLRFLGEGPGYFEYLEEIAVTSKCEGAMIHDARIAALCATHGVRQLWSADRDFSRFPKLKIINPLVQ
jgi:toxin-antitoxin system PIN domain toxin